MERDEYKNKVCKKIEENKDEIIDLVKLIYDNPETGYKEQKTTAIIKTAFESLNLKTEENIAVTGIKASIGDYKKDKLHLAILGELDALICEDHPDRDIKTKAVHACGHNNQIGIMFGVAYGLIKSKIFKKLDAIIDFMAVPAEEYIEIDYRKNLIKKNRISYLGGKQELIKRGYFDDVDIAMMVHSLDVGDMKDVIVGPTGNGFITKKIGFIDKKPDTKTTLKEKIDILCKAILAINNINTRRKVIRDNDKKRVYPMNTKSGQVVNITFENNKITSYITGRTVQSILDANKKVNRVIEAKAAELKGEVEIEDLPGYLPLINYKTLMNIFAKNLDKLVPNKRVIQQKTFTGSFDMGDISHIMPALHPFFSGVSGGLHTKHFSIDDYELAVIKPAKALAKTIIDIIIDKEKVFDQLDKPPCFKKEYLGILNEMNSNQ